MEEIKNESTVESEVVETKVEGTGNEEKSEKQEKLVSLKEAQEMVDKAMAKKLPPKEEMEQFKQWKESRKTEEQKQQERQAEIEQIKQENEQLKNEKIAFKKDISKDYLNYVIFEAKQLINEETTFEDALDYYLKTNPQYLNSKQTPKNTGLPNNGVSQQTNGIRGILEQKHGIKIN